MLQHQDTPDCVWNSAIIWINAMILVDLAAKKNELCCLDSYKQIVCRYMYDKYKQILAVIHEMAKLQ